MRGKWLVAIAVFGACGAPEPNLSETEQLAVVVGPAMHNFGTITIGEQSNPATFVVSPSGSGQSDNTIMQILGCPAFPIAAPGVPGAQVFRHCSGVPVEPTNPQAADAGECVDPQVQTYSFTARFVPNAIGNANCVGQIIMNSGVQSFTMFGNGEAPPFVIDVRPRNLPFGDIRVGDPSDVLVVTVTNLGSQALDLDVQQMGASAFVLAKGALGDQTLPKGQAATFELLCMPPTADPFTGNFQINSNDPDSPTIDIAMTCNGIMSLLDIEPTFFDAETLVNKTKQVTVNLKNEGNVEGTLKSVAFSNNTHPKISFINRPAMNTPIGAQATLPLTIQFAPDDKVSGDDGLGSVIVQFDNDVPRTIAINGGAKLASVATNPTALDFNQVCVGVPKDLEVDVYADDDGSFEVTGASATGDFSVATTAVPHLLGPPGSDREVLTVTVTAGAPGEISSAIVVDTTAPGQEAYEIPVRALGLEAGVTVDKTEMAIGAIEVGGFTPAQTATVTNCSGATVMLMDARIVGPNAGEFVLTKAFQPTSIANAESFSIDVQFAPKAAGRRDATLLVEYAGGVLEVALFGDAAGVFTSRDSYYRCSTGGTGAWPVGLVVLGFALRRRRRYS